MGKSSMRNPLDALPSWADAGECPGCGKRMYREKKDAKNAVGAKHPRDRMSVYRCVDESELVPEPRPWHIGHLASVVKSGIATRSEWYGDGELSETICSYMDSREEASGLRCSLGRDHNGPHLAQNMLGDWINIDPSN